MTQAAPGTRRDVPTSPGPARALGPAPGAPARPGVNGIPICQLEEEVISFLSCLLNTVPQRGIISNVPHDMNSNRFSNDQLHHLLLCNLSLTTLKIYKKIKIKRGGGGWRVVDAVIAQVTFYRGRRRGGKNGNLI